MIWASKGEDAIPKLLPYVDDTDIAVRIEAVKSLNEIGGPENGRSPGQALRRPRS